MRTKNVKKKLLAMALMVAMMLSVIAPTALAETATALGGNLTATLYNQNGTAPNSNVTLLHTPANGTTVEEGADYYLTRVDEVYDIFDGNGDPKDLQFVIHMSYNFANASVNPVYYYNQLRYFYIIEAETGELAVDGNVDEVTMSSVAQVATITVPHKYLKAETAYYVIFGSSTCGNNNGKILIAPVVYQITTGNREHTAAVDTSFADATALDKHNITLNVIASDADTVSTAAFNRFASTTWGSGVTTTYAVGDPITASIPGQEIAIKAAAGDGLTATVQVEAESGYPVSIHNRVQGIGGNFNDYGDTRFTMPNENVTINAIFGYETTFADEEGNPVPTDQIAVTDESGRTFKPGIVLGTLTNNAGKLYYNDEAVEVDINGAVVGDNRYVLPAGKYTYTVTKDGAISTHTFTVSQDDTVTTITPVPATTATISFSVTPDNAAVVVKKDIDGSAVDPEEDDTYNLIVGETYSYTVSAEGYETKSGMFTVSDGGQTITAELEISTASTYEVTFNVTPSDATVAVMSGDTVIQPETDGTYQLPAGNYTYEVSAGGYVTKTGTFTVSDEAIDVSVKLEVFQSSAYRLTVTTYPKRSSVVVRDSGGNPVTADPDGSYQLPDGEYTYEVSKPGYKTESIGFVVAGEDLDLSFTLTAQVDLSHFEDINTGEWYRNAVEYSVANNLFVGTSGTTWEPDTAMTRAMFVTALGKYEGVDADQYSTCDFKDVPDGEWYTAYAQWAFEAELVVGTGDNNFAPDRIITRQEMAVIFYKYVESKGIGMTVSDDAFEAFPDSNETTDWAVTAMTWAVGKHIMKGDDHGNLMPLGTASRSQVAQVFMVIIEDIL